MKGIERKGRGAARKYRARMSIDGRIVTGRWREKAAQANEDRDGLRKKASDTPRDVQIGTLREAFAAVLREARRMRRRPATVNYYRERFRILSGAFGRGFLLRNLTTEMVQQFAEARLNGKIKDRKSVTRSTVHSDVISLGRATRLAVKRGWLRADPVTAADIPKPDSPEPDWFAVDELHGLLVQVRGTPPTERLDPARDADIVEFLALTGLRLKEAAQLLVRDVSPERRVIVVREGKTGSRTLPMNPDAVFVCRRMTKHRDRFGRRLGEQYLPVSYDGIGSMFRRWKKRLKEPRLKPHAMRHTFGTALARAGASEQHIKTLMGHRTTYMANRYIHIAGADIAHVAALVSYGAGTAKVAAGVAPSRPLDV